MTKTDVERFDEWLTEKSTVAALVIRQWFEPVEGKHAVILPPTYLPSDLPPPDGARKRKSIYNIDRFGDGTSICQLDSVGSQANRMEPLFQKELYRHLVPFIEINARVSGSDKTINILEAGHRAADAIVRFSELGPALHEAFSQYVSTGNAEPLARLAPTSIVFGAWDSRATQAKLPRIVRSVVRAYNVKECHRSAQYTTIAGEILSGGEAEVAVEGPKAELGLAHVPASWTLGGVIVEGEIRRDAILKLETIRHLGAANGPDAAIKLRRYILGLSLVAITAPPHTFLREGCELKLDGSRSSETRLVLFSGPQKEFVITHEDALEFATSSANQFEITQNKRPYRFDSDLANDVLKLTKDERKELLRGGPVTRERIKELRKKKTKKKEKEQEQKESETQSFDDKHNETGGAS